MVRLEAFEKRLIVDLLVDKGQSRTFKRFDYWVYLTSYQSTNVVSHLAVDTQAVELAFKEIGPRERRFTRSGSLESARTRIR